MTARSYLPTTTGFESIPEPEGTARADGALRYTTREPYAATMNLEIRAGVRPSAWPLPPTPARNPPGRVGSGKRRTSARRTLPTQLTPPLLDSSPQPRAQTPQTIPAPLHTPLHIRDDESPPTPGRTPRP